MSSQSIGKKERNHAHFTNKTSINECACERGVVAAYLLLMLNLLCLTSVFIIFPAKYNLLSFTLSNISQHCP